LAVKAAIKQFTITTEIPTTPKKVFDDWLDVEQHSALTQTPVTPTDTITGIFTAHDGYINGINLELDYGKPILQTWRTTKFEGSGPDFCIEVTF
jgi:hypothetical protein